MTTPTPLGLAKSFGFGDRLGVATAGHLAAARKYDFLPIFAQQSIRELTRTQRTATEVIQAATNSLEANSYEGKWGADADHLKTVEDIKMMAEAGFTFFTLDPSSHLNTGVKSLDSTALKQNIKKLEEIGSFNASYYLNKSFQTEKKEYRFDQEGLYRIVLKYKKAIDHCVALASEIRRHRNFADVEVSFDETDDPTTALEHIFIASELKRMGVAVTSFAPRFVGSFEKGIEYRGNLKEFEAHLTEHMEIAKAFGPYKLSIHSGSDKFMIYPAIGRICGELLHVKTSGTSYLECLRTVCRTDSRLFGEIAAFTHDNFATDQASYHISTTQAEIDALKSLPSSEFEKAYLDSRPGRQLLHVTFGSVLSKGKGANGKTFREAILENLENNKSLTQELLTAHFDKHFKALIAG